ncbi:alanine racemase [Aeromicrobium duanguangcaii]|uniref:alanine racemase n=1 Tax=Aeromicrobium duanguangcaii TaxID=2968086 RepID=UPI002016EFF9|nr:alanine racemase [Aeromicrobium duanguangcaii]MCL3838175.1 alanine racemase [Aeromicrobium duanguangcaii]
MAFDLQIRAADWRAHLVATRDAHPAIVPVIKGNGYGLGRQRLAGEAFRLGADMISVGTYEEAAELLGAFTGDVQVLTPWRPFSPRVADGRLIHTVSRIEDIAPLAAQLPGARIVVEGLTSMARHGMDRHSITEAARLIAEAGLVVEGFAIHLPMAGANLPEARTWCAILETSALATTTVFCSHLTVSELEQLRTERPNLTIRPRVGTALWLGRLDTLEVRSTVLDVHTVQRGERVGYRQGRVPRDGHVLVVAGGTSHGIGLEAPRAVAGVAGRGKAVAKGGLAAAGLALSPFTVAGKQRWFVEPPHMQASMILLPEGVPVPAVGDRLPAAVRYTIAQFDAITEV